MVVYGDWHHRHRLCSRVRKRTLGVAKKQSPRKTVEYRDPKSVNGIRPLKFDKSVMHFVPCGFHGFVNLGQLRPLIAKSQHRRELPPGFVDQVLRCFDCIKGSNNLLAVGIRKLRALPFVHGWIHTFDIVPNFGRFDQEYEICVGKLRFDVRIIPVFSLAAIYGTIVLLPLRLLQTCSGCRQQFDLSCEPNGAW
jgi:hypothetical protein